MIHRLAQQRNCPVFVSSLCRNTTEVVQRFSGVWVFEA